MPKDCLNLIYIRLFIPSGLFMPNRWRLSYTFCVNRSALTLFRKMIRALFFTIITNKVSIYLIHICGSYAIGGLSGGEDKDSFWRVVAQCTAALPEDKPRYVMVMVLSSHHMFIYTWKRDQPSLYLIRNWLLLVVALLVFSNSVWLLFCRVLVILLIL